MPACAQCGKDFHCKPSHAARRKHCSKACMAGAYKSQLRGEGNPNFRFHVNAKCEMCAKDFKRYGPFKRFCSIPCARVAQASWGRRQKEMRYAARVDDNQAEIVKALEKAGACVVVASSLGGGFPDLIVGTRKNTYLLEVKNPKTGYGKRGLNELQKIFFKTWAGHVAVVTTPEEALVACELSA